MFNKIYSKLLKINILAEIEQTNINYANMASEMIFVGHGHILNDYVKLRAANDQEG